MGFSERIMRNLYVGVFCCSLPMASDDDAEIQRYKNSRRMGLTLVRLKRRFPCGRTRFTPLSAGLRKILITTLWT